MSFTFLGINFSFLNKKTTAKGDNIDIENTSIEANNRIEKGLGSSEYYRGVADTYKEMFMLVFKKDNPEQIEED